MCNLINETTALSWGISFNPSYCNLIIINIRFLYIGNEWNQKNDNNEKYIFNFVFSFCVLQLHYIYIQQINQENYYSFRVHFI